jgi:Family of unknown function (DUF5519)
MTLGRDTQARCGWPGLWGSAMLAGAVLAAAWVVRDYRGWLALGPGGLPPTPRGWLTMAVLRALTWRVDPFATRGVTGIRHLTDPLPVRAGPRPAVAHYPIPHRQLDQFPDRGFTTTLTVASFVGSRPDLTVRQSYFEKHNDAAFAALELPVHADGQVSGGEIGHIHADGSLHAVLAATDAATAIEHGWGQLHPAAGRAAGLPSTYVLLYSPRNPDEVAVVERLLDAAAAHMTGNQLAP